jgi:hypothetical protein
MTLEGCPLQPHLRLFAVGQAVDAAAYQKTAIPIPAVAPLASTINPPLLEVGLQYRDLVQHGITLL